MNGAGNSIPAESKKPFYRLNVEELIKNTKKFQGFQQQLLIILHVRHCVGVRGVKPQLSMHIEKLGVVCKFPPCQLMKVVFHHIRSCKEGESCSTPHCFTTKQIIDHWMKCSHTDCILCSPVQKRIERSNAGGVKIAADAIRLKKPWQNDFSQLRDDLVTKIVKLILPTITETSLNDSRYETLIKFVKKIEKQTFDESNDQSHFYKCLGEQIQRVQAKLQEKFPNPMSPPSSAQQQRRLDVPASASLVCNHINDFDDPIPVIILPKIAKTGAPSSENQTVSPTAVDLDNPKPSTSGVSSNKPCKSSLAAIPLSQNNRSKRPG